jgi:hypothetical protein
MAKTIASGLGMTNAWLAEQGGLSLKTPGPNLLIFVEPPGADPHAVVVWGGARKRAGLPDFWLFVVLVLER